MRIKKKELLEALDKDKTIASLNSGKELIDAAKEFEDYAKEVVDPEVADELTDAIVSTKEQKLEEEGSKKSHQRTVKEVIKVKNLKK